jgi:hypothetical protein
MTNVTFFQTQASAKRTPLHLASLAYLPGALMQCPVICQNESHEVPNVVKATPEHAEEERVQEDDTLQRGALCKRTVSQFSFSTSVQSDLDGHQTQRTLFQHRVLKAYQTRD